MALKAMLICLLASFLLVTISHSHAAMPVEAPHHAPWPWKDHYPPMKAPAHPSKAPPPYHHSEPGLDCTPRCEEHCKTHRKKRPCMKACTACCHKYKCVPTGTYGKEEKCKIWDHAISRGQYYKCP